METQGWTALLARLTGKYGAAWWAMAYANNPFWRSWREQQPHNMQPIEMEACQHVLDNWPLEDNR